MAPPKSRKVAIMGFRSVGKSSLSIQFVEGQFVDSYDPTIENTFQAKIKHRGHDYQIDLVDTAGQDEYSIIPQSYVVDNHGYVLVYSVTSRKSFEVVKDIRDRLLDLTGTTSLPILLVGNKTDLHMERVISSDEGSNLAKRWKAGFLESSAKENKLVHQVFHAIIDEIEKQQNGPQPKGGGCIIS
ncbi:GTP-binding protein Rheb-like [Hydractinia symbiolongicarpus]|uniref:GTP-binding protein Rheb-like n=1 Tax=Hydractinia symbiolongicarpus TaxID=13093 RepID=UPI00254A8B3F|nr:GTP-binding protein Rheb-like [Hydractinia symbiolongicarpus]